MAPRREPKEKLEIWTSEQGCLLEELRKTHEDSNETDESAVPHFGVVGVDKFEALVV